MKLLLVNPPNGRIDRTYLAPPLGLLTLAAVIRGRGYDVSVLDFNLEVLSNPALGEQRFYNAALEMIAEVNPDAVGFTSMCLESHVSLELARRIKDVSPEVVTIFGGTHFGAIAREVLENFLFADFVVSGEAEHAILAILDNDLRGSVSLPSNVFYRHKDQVLSGLTDNPSPLLEELPFPAYDLVDLQRYFSLNPFRLLNYEAGRGCVFKCSFCYSPFQYGDAVRNKNPDKVVEDLRKLSEIGARHIFFVQDNLLNSPRWASELCQKLAAADLPLTWECYVTYPQLKESLIDLLADAGCKGIFTGIDAVATGAQERMNKPFLRDWDKVSHKLSYSLSCGIQPLCAFILEEPEQDQKKNEAAIHTALRCVDLGCEIHLNTLSIYNHTSLDLTAPAARASYSSAKAKLLMDAPDVVQSNEFARGLPHLFPYHSTTSAVNSWEVHVARVHTLSSLVAGLRRTLLRYVVEEGNSIWKSLEYIDNDFAARLMQLEPWERREAAVLEFNRHFALQHISRETRAVLSREVAGVLLSKKRAGRSVNLIVDATERTYNLAWFVDLERLQPSESQSWAGISPGMTINRQVLPQSSSEHKISLLSQGKMIKVFSTSPEFAELLLKLESASASRRSVSLSGDEVKSLEQDGWIWAQS